MVSLVKIIWKIKISNLSMDFENITFQYMKGDFYIYLLYKGVCVNVWFNV